MTTAGGVRAEDLEAPEFRGGGERTTLPREGAIRVAGSRAEHNLTQSELGRLLGMRQPAVARLEAGEHEPSLTTLKRLSSRLGIEFHIDITQRGLTLVTA